MNYYLYTLIPKMAQIFQTLLHGRCGYWKTWVLHVMVLVTLGVVGLWVPSMAASANPITVENQQPGSAGWKIGVGDFSVADDVSRQIKGYASATSVNKGEAITLHVTVNPAQTYTMDVYRMGWYQGLGGRLLQHIGPLDGFQQPACPVDPVTGLIECNWTPSYTLAVPTTVTSGVFLVKLTNAQGYQNYITFVVRDDASSADILYQTSVTTYQAYNNYPNDGATGKSLYASFNSFGANTVGGTRAAVKVSFDRPYADDGSGEFLSLGVYFVRWLEHAGYDVSYATDLDTHRQSAQLLSHKAFLSVGHDEYWSKAMYDGVEQARDAGVHLGFFGANMVYWQVRFEASPLTGAADRVMVSYKNAALEPIQGPTLTTLWRAPQLQRPEQRLIGVQYNEGVTGTWPYVATNTSHWVYEGTGLADGDSIPGIFGDEVDWLDPTVPLPTSIVGTYALLSQSPVVTREGENTHANTSIYQAPSGAWVFGAGSITWSWGLDKAGVADARIQQITANVLNRFVGNMPPTVATDARRPHPVQ